jgi:hypothetical protein
MGGGDDFPSAHDDGTNRDFVDTPRVHGQIKRQSHEKGIIPDQLGWAELLEGAGEAWAGRWAFSFHGCRITVWAAEASG